MQVFKLKINFLHALVIHYNFMGKRWISLCLVFLWPVK